MTTSIENLRHHIFDKAAKDFVATALEVFHFQARENNMYRQYLELLQVDPANIQSISEIPFLPIQFFKTHRIMSTEQEPEVVFESSGTTLQTKSKHYVADLSLYEASIQQGFVHFYGSVEEYHFLALLPSYLERQQASLVHMVDFLMKRSGKELQGFFLHDHAQLMDMLQKLEAKGQKTMLVGVTFALLELAKQYELDLNNTIVMETGGMKGRGPELTRMEVHEKLTKAFGLEQIHSEYGMTELLSQAYSMGNGLFQTPPWMHVQCRDINDPFELVPHGHSGMLEIIDLANLYSCSFIETADLGKVNADGTFEVLGRVDNSDVRGCNLMV